MYNMLLLSILSLHAPTDCYACGLVAEGSRGHDGTIFSLETHHFEQLDLDSGVSIISSSLLLADEPIYNCIHGIVLACWYQCWVVQSQNAKPSKGNYPQHAARCPATMFSIMFSLILLQRSRYELWRGFGSDGYLYDFVKKSYNLLDQADMQAMFDAAVHYLETIPMQNKLPSLT